MMDIMRTALVAVSVVALGGCTIKMAPGPIEHYQKSIALDKSEMSRVEVKMGAGELKIAGGSPQLMDADFEYDIPSWKPNVRYNASSFRGELVVEQPGNSNAANNVTYKWDLRFNDKLPIDLVTHLGAGQANLNLGSMNLRSLEVHMGVGQVELDLRGKPTRDYNVEIHGGIGQAIVHLPSDVGIVANAAGGIGDIQVRGLEKRDGQWVNASREHSTVTIHLDVKGGIGNITLIAE
jgi:hypothetical protein